MTTDTTQKITMPDFFFEKLATLIEGDDKRMEFLPSKIGATSFLFENAVYNQASQLCPDYNGGYWEFADLKKPDNSMLEADPNQPNAFFIFPLSDKAFSVSTCYSQEVVDGRTFGLCTCICVFSGLSFHYANSNIDLAKKYSHYYHACRDAFYGAVDYFLDDPNNKDTITDEQREQVEALSSAVFSILD